MFDDDASLEHDDGPRICTRFVERLAVTGASISVAGHHGQHTIGASDHISAQLEKLQFELGEGPHHETLRTGKPTLVSRVDEGVSRWPIFGEALSRIAVGALFSFPLRIGAATVGVVDTYRSTPGPLSPDMISRAFSLASWTAGPALRLAALSANDEAPTARQSAPGVRREVHQATGIILAQLGISASEAFSRLQAHSFSSGQTLEYVAHEVVARRINFQEMSD